MSHPGTAPRTPDLAVLMAEIGSGGMGKMRVQLMNAIVDAGYSVDLLLGKQKGRHRLELDPRIRVIDIGTTHAVFGVPRLAAYLLRHRPRVLLTQRIRVTVLAHRARALARVPTRIFATGETHESTSVKTYPEAEQRKRLGRIRKYFGRNDGMIATSRGVAEDHAALMDWPVEAITVVPSPVLTPAIESLARESVDHPWFAAGQPPVIISAGRLEAPKDYPTLLRAFALFRQHHDARLVILGEGPLRPELEALASDLGIAADFNLPGFTANVYAPMAHSRMFVLSSAWEGFGSVLVEAMAVGTPVVSTDCQSGPAEILADGIYGPLAPCGDPEALAACMERCWNDPVDADTLRNAAFERYSSQRSAEAYVRALGIARQPMDRSH